MHIEEQPEGRFQIIFLLLLSFIRENSTEPLLWHLPSVVTAIKFTAEFSHEEGNRRSAFGGCLRSDVERVEIQKRWKSRDVETGGTFIEDDCVQCNRVGAAIPQLVTYSPLPPHLFPPSSSALPIFPVASLSFDDNNNDVVVVVADDDGLLSSVSLEQGKRERFDSKRMRLSRPSWPSSFREVQQTGRARPPRSN